MSNNPFYQRHYAWHLTWEVTLKEKNISMGKLSRLSNVSFSTINRICNDPTYSPTLNTLDRIAKALQIPIAELYEEVPD